MPKSSDNQPDPSRSLFEGSMDVEGMEDVLELYRELYPLSSTGLKTKAKIRIPSDKETEMRLEEGFTLLEPVDLMPVKKELKGRAAAVLKALSRHSERNDAILRLQDGLKDPDFAPSLVRAYLEGGEEGLRKEIQSRRGIDEELGLFLVFNTIKGSFKRAGLMRGDVSAKGWEKGTCPVCGGLPAVACLTGEEGQRHLICHRCEARWRFPIITCPFCGNNDHRSLGYFTVEDGDPVARVDFCTQCSGYIKSWDIREREDVFPQYEDLRTISYDMAAESEGYQRGGPNIFGISISFGGAEEADQ